MFGERSGKQPVHHLVGGFQVFRLLHDATGNIRVTGYMGFVVPESGGGKALQIGLHHLSVHVDRAETGEKVSAELLVLASCHGEIGLGKVHEGVSTVEERLELGGELIPVHGGKDQHGITGIDLRDQGGEIILLDAVGGMLALATVAGKTYTDVFLTNIECGDFCFALKLLCDAGLQRVGIALSSLTAVDD